MDDVRLSETKGRRRHRMGGIRNDGRIRVIIKRRRRAIIPGRRRVFAGSSFEGLRQMMSTERQHPTLIRWNELGTLLIALFNGPFASRTTTATTSTSKEVSTTRSPLC